ncbi:MFS transporter [bacterium]|nr:MFS transporter [bacterium]
MGQKQDSPEQPGGKLHPNVVAAGWVSFFTDLGSEMIYPLLPIFITSNLGASRTMLGLIEGISEATPSIFKLFSGFISDRIRNRKWLIFLGYFISSSIKPLIGLSINAWQVLAIRFLDRVGKGIRGSPRDALIADSTIPEKRGVAFGFQRAMDHLGALGGGLVAWILLTHFSLSLKQVILVSIFPGFFCLLTILFFIRELPNRPMNRFEPLKTKISYLPKEFWKLLVGITAFAIANSSDAFLILRSREMGIEVVWIPFVWSFLHFVKSVSCYFGGGLSDKFGPKLVVGLGWVLYSFVYLGFAVFNSSVAVVILFGIYGVFFGMTEGSVKAWAANLVPVESRGTAFGFLGLAGGLMVFPASLLAGLLWDVYGSFIPLLMATIISFASAIWLFFAVPNKAVSF